MSEEFGFLPGPVDPSEVSANLRETLLDHAHHALGRPEWPTSNTYRNYFATTPGGTDATAFDASPWWRLGRAPSEGMPYATYVVTDEGKAAVWAWMAEKNRAAGLRRYHVSIVFDGKRVGRDLMAKSRSAARYAYFLEAADALSCDYAKFLTYGPRVALT